MSLNLEGTLVMFLAGAPMLGVVAGTAIFYLKRAGCKRNKRSRNRHAGFSALTFSMGMALQHLEMLINHNVQHVIEERFDQDADDDGQGEPDDPKAQMRRQLRRIRSGEPVDRLILRLK
jgi:hypothetical protein